MASSAFSVAELAELTGVSATSIYRELLATGHVLGVKGFQIRRRWVIPRRPIEIKLGIAEGGAA